MFINVLCPHWWAYWGSSYGVCVVIKKLLSLVDFCICLRSCPGLEVGEWGRMGIYLFLFIFFPSMNGRKGSFFAFPLILLNPHSSTRLWPIVVILLLNFTSNLYLKIHNYKSGHSWNHWLHIWWYEFLPTFDSVD